MSNNQENDKEESDDREQVSVRTPPEMKERWRNWINDDQTPHNTYNDLIRTAVEDYIHRDDGVADDAKEASAVADELHRLRSSIDNLEASFDELDTLDQGDVDDSVDSTVRQLLYTVLLNNDDVDGIELNK
jgi:predicted DNA-binding protein